MTHSFRARIGLAVVTAALAGAASEVSRVHAADTDLRGSWKSEIYTLKDGTRHVMPGLLIFTKDGRYSSHLMRADRPKFASKNRLQGTPEENKAVVHGSIASFGTYTVDEAKKTYTLHIEGSTYPNLEGTESTRPFAISGGELKVTNPAPTTGGPASQAVYKRAK